jgi:hypothetical protein
MPEIGRIEAGSSDLNISGLSVTKGSQDLNMTKISNKTFN